VDLAVIAVAFGAIFLVELPDKTFVAALVLATRYRPAAVWVGVGLAFLVQTAIACTVGQVVTYLPQRVVESVAALIFLVGAVLLLREAPKADAGEAETEEEFAAKARVVKTGWAAVLSSFLVLFAAEWGDLSQLLTISLVGRYHDAWSVYVGAWSALLLVSGLAVVA
jgi:putative Ca2+/H+ antiporter (TMEM165/GDT1 family)